MLSKKHNCGVETIQGLSTENRMFITFYIWITLYILIFRITYDVVGPAEPEYYPLEIISTIVVVLTLILSALIYYEHRETTGEKDRLYFALIIVFVILIYYIRKNVELSKRESEH